MATKIGRSGGRNPNCFMTAIPSTFCDAIVTRNSGSPTLTSVAGSIVGVVGTSTGARPDAGNPGPLSTISTTATASAAGTAHGRANCPTSTQTMITGAAGTGTSATPRTGARHSGSRPAQRGDQARDHDEQAAQQERPDGCREPAGRRTRRDQQCPRRAWTRRR